MAYVYNSNSNTIIGIPPMTDSADSLDSPYYATYSYISYYDKNNNPVYRTSSRKTSNVTVSGGNGNDSINIGSSGSISVRSGKGDDTIKVSSNGSGYFYGEDGDDVISGIGNLYGGIGDDVISGSGNLYGENGDDVISAGNLSNITGGKDDDKISTNGGCKSHSTIN